MNVVELSKRRIASDARPIFLATLRAGLRGAPPDKVDEIIADYVGYFDDGAAASRSDEDIAAALGDPLALADELCVELRIARWEQQRTPRSAVRVLGGVLALGVVNTTLLCLVAPVVLLLGAALIIQTVSLLAVGIWLPFGGAILALPGGLITLLLLGVGCIAAAICLFALTALALVALVNGLSRYARLHYRLLSLTPLVRRSR